MNYIKRNYNGIEVNDYTTTSMNTGFRNFIQQLCLKNYSTLEGRIEFSKMISGSNSKVPFFVSDDILLVPTHSFRNYKCILINLFNIQDYYRINDKIRVVFKNSQKLDIDVRINTIKNQLKKANVLVEYIVKRKCLHDGLINRFYYENLV